jgi:hypothetical protein
MKRSLVLLPVFALGMAAQDSIPQLERTLDQLKQVELQMRAAKVQGAVMGPTVKGAPYSALETVEDTQTLGDGTHINQTIQTMVYRDNEGRMRRETPDSVMIWDPVASTSYELNPKTQTARKMPLGLTHVYSTAKGANGQVVHFEYDGGEPLPAPPPPPIPGNQVRVVAAGRGGRAGFGVTGKTESLGRQTIEGVNAEGTRDTSTIEVGEIGNDRPIQSIRESWYSPDLQTTVKMVHSDPRTGQETFTLTNISRTEPPADLFQVPPGYQMVGK